MIPRIYDDSFSSYESNGLGLLVDTTECQVEEESNGVFELTLIYPVIGSFFNAIVKDNIIKAHASDELKNQLFRIDTISKPENGQVKVYAKHISFDLEKNTLNEDVNIRDVSCESAGNQMLSKSDCDSRFSIKSNIEMLGNYAMDRKTDVLSAIAGTEGSLIDTYGNGAKLLRDNFNISVLNRRGKDNNVLIAYAKNITGFTLDEDSSDIINRIKPYASYTDENNNEVCVYIDEVFIDSERITEGDIIKSKWIDFSDKFDYEEIPTQEKLRLYARQYFSDNNCDIPKLSYKIEFQPLSQTEEYKDILADLEHIGMDDTVYIANSMYGIRDQARVIKTKYDVLSEKYISIELGDPKTSLGSIISGSNADKVTKDEVKDIINKTNKKDYPNTLPEIPIVSIDRQGFKTISLSWQYENKPYYNYEVYASQEKGFTPNAFDLIFKGQASAFLHEVECGQTWYYKVRAVNTYNNATDFSDEVSATTTKISDASDYFKEAAIESALIGSLNADVINAGKVLGTYIDARNLNVIDGNGNTTMSVSSDGIVKLIQGLIDISDEGIKINLVDSENNILGYVLYDGQGVQIFTQLDEAISHFTREGSYIDNLVASHIKCNELLKIANRSGCSTNWYIAAEATGDGTGRDEENKATSLKDVLRRIRQYGLHFTDKLTINIESGIIEEDIVMQDFYGTKIQINIAKGVVMNTSKFIFEDCSARIYMTGETNNVSCTDSEITADEVNSRAIIKTSKDKLFQIRNCNYIRIEGFQLKGSGNCVEGINSSEVFLRDCDIKGFSYGAYADDMSKICMGDCRGSVNYMAYVGYGAIFSSTVGIPKCNQSDLVDVRQSGIWIKEASYTQLDTLQTESTTTETATNIKESFDITELYTKVEGTGLGTSSRQGYTGQGKYKSYKPHRGYIILPSSQIMQTIQSKENYTLKLKLTRRNTEHGYNSKTPHPVLRAIGAGIETDYWDSEVKFARGETQVITLPDAIKSAIAQGATRLELWADTNQAQQYSFYDSVSLIIEGANKQSSTGGSGEGGTSEETINDFAYADDLVEIAMTYYRVCDNEYTSGHAWSQGFTYRASNTPMSGECESAQDVTNSLWVKVTNKDGSSTRHYKAIDCSTGANMWLRGIPYASSPYASETLFNSFRTNRLQKNDGVAWSIAPVRADGKPARYAYELCNYFYRMNKGIVFLKDPDTNKILKGSIGTSEDDYSNIKKGDIVFYAKKDENGNWKRPGDDEFMHVSHVAICYGHSNTYNKKAVIESTNVTTKKHSFDDGTSYNAGMRIKQIETYADSIVMVVRLQESHYSSSSSGDTGTTTETQEYTNCINTTGIIDGNNYIYKLKNCKVTAYGGDSGSACNIPLNLGKTCGSFNLPYGTKIYIPSLDGFKITDKNGKSVTCDGVFTVNDTGVGCTDFDLYMSTYSDSNAESIFGNTRREDVYILSYGSGYGYAWSYTQSYKWAYNNGTLSAYKVAFKDYIKYNGTLINFLKFKDDDKDIRNSTYWSILNS